MQQLKICNHTSGIMGMSKFWLSLTTDYAANATSHSWRLFIPHDGSTGMEQSSS